MEQRQTDVPCIYRQIPLKFLTGLHRKSVQESGRDTVFDVQSVCKNCAVMWLFCWGTGGEVGLWEITEKIWEPLMNYNNNTVAHLAILVAFAMNSAPEGTFRFAIGECYDDLHSYREILAVWSCAVMTQWETTRGNSSLSRGCSPTSRATWPTFAGRLRPWAPYTVTTLSSTGASATA